MSDVYLNKCYIHNVTHKMSTLREYVEELLSCGSIRHTNETPKRIYVYDFIQYMTDVADPKRAYVRLCRKDPDISALVGMYSIDGSRPVPVTDLRGMYLIANWCKGRKATEFRVRVTSMLARFCGGDQSLHDEVRANAESSRIVSQFL